MRITNNLPALTAFNSLNSTNKSLQKVINSLSTGLRINSAADDAAGFAVSEKMRSQISGLYTALRNSQDGISMLQTAEGALGETNSMLQRMRELCVQAGNDTLTSQDRHYIQLEIDELRDQIDRIADTTQFNKKRILDGSSGAIWTSSDKNLRARINGGLVEIDRFGQKVSREGNYRVEMTSEFGQPQVQKSNIMNLSEIRFETVVTQTPITETQLQTRDVVHVIDLSTQLDNSQTPAASGDGWEFTTNSAGQTFLRIYGDGKFNLTGTAPDGMYVEIASTAANADVFLHDVNIDCSALDDTLESRPIYLEAGANVNMYISGNNTLKGGSLSAGLDVASGASITITSLNGDFSDSGTLTATGGEQSAGIGSYAGNFGTITINGGTIQAFGGELAAGIGSGDGTTTASGTININGGNITAVGGGYSDEGELLPDNNIAFYSFAGAGIGCGVYDTNNININITGGTIKAEGGTCLVTYGGDTIAQTGAAGIGSGPQTDSGTININNDVSITATPGQTDFDNLPSGYTPPELSSTQAPEAERIGCGWGGTANSSSVNLNAGLSVPSAREIPDKPTTQYTEEVEVITGYDTEETTEEVTHYKALSENSQFYSPSGTFIISSPQTITITQGNGQTASVTLYSTDTMQDVADKINSAIAYELGQAKYTDNCTNFCTLSDGTQSTSESVYDHQPIYDEDGNLTGYDIYSTMLIRSAIPGKAGELCFSGDEDILRALGLNTIQLSTESTHTVSVYEAHTGKVIASNVKAAGKEFLSLISPNIDIEIDPMAGLSANWDETTKRFLTGGQNVYTAMLHLKNNGILLQTGANQGEDFIIQLGDSSSSALNLSGVNVMTREAASRAVTTLDLAIHRISSQREKIASYTNALEHITVNLTTTAANLTESESRIRDADIAESMMNFVKLQILTQSGTSMLAQANQLPQSVLSLMQ